MEGKIGRMKKLSQENKIQKESKRSPKQKTSSFIAWRFRVVFGFILFCLLLLLIKASYIQIIDANFYISKADDYSLRAEKISTGRGTIVDRNGNPLAVSVRMYDLILDPKMIIQENSLAQKEKWQALATILDLPYSTLTNIATRNPNSRFEYLKRQVPKEIADYIRQLKLAGIVINPTYRRFYLKGETTAQIIGFTNIDNQGQEGIEKSFNNFLTGQAGTYVYRQDRHGKRVEDIAFKQKQTPHEITLSIDERLQSKLYQELKRAVAENQADSGTAVLADVQTGEILAMASAPSYNPNNRNSIAMDPAARRDRAISDTFEPGSTIKPFVVLTALERKIIRPDTVIDTRPFTVDGHTIRDVAPRNELDITGILQKSSNVGVSRLALQMPPEALMQTYDKAGFGHSTDLGLLGERSGILPINRKRWADIERATVAYGYGLTVTPLQLVRAYITLGSFGIYRPVSITKIDPPVIGKRVFPEEITRTVVRMMESVALPGGGGVKAGVQDYRVAVKTGTAKKLEKGKYVDKYLAYTAGIAPASNPRFALVVLIDEPKAGKYYGGSISAPVFSRIMEYALRLENVKPDNLQETKNAMRVIKLNSTTKK